MSHDTIVALILGLVALVLEHARSRRNADVEDRISDHEARLRVLESK